MKQKHTKLTALLNMSGMPGEIIRFALSVSSFKNPNNETEIQERLKFICTARQEEITNWYNSETGKGKKS